MDSTLSTTTTGEPPGVAAVREACVRRLAGRVEADGAIREPCEGRILETALLLSLLRKQHTLPAVQTKLERYLSTATAATALDATIAGAMLLPGRRPRAADGVAPGGKLPNLASLHPFTGHRKRLLLATVLAILGVGPYDPATRPHQIAYGGYAAWTDLSLCAVRMLHTAAQDGSPDDTDTAWLTERLSAFPHGQIWEGNALAHLVALHALHTRAPQHPVLHAGIVALTEAVREDGGMPFIAGQEVWVTALAGAALAEAGADPALLHRIGDYLAARQQDDGGWGYNETTTQTDVDDTSRCAVTLHLTGGHLRYGTHLKQARKYLTAMAGTDGGFPTYLKGHASEADLTAGALIALAQNHPSQRNDDHSDLVRSSAEFLMSAQIGNGSWEPSWTLSVTSVTAHAVDALSVAARTVPAIAARTRSTGDAARSYLDATQNTDGGWGHRPGEDSDVISTAHALPVLRPGHQAETALHYLLSHQSADAAYHARPDQVGPRPFPYDFPLLADVHVCTALARSRRLPR
ncbi:squalene-hopene/tetraprenyl-beta-curcumene cyclase [Streptomyces sp. yr375]|uniref:prenyltransferase/squalene oxidase repeat-containing protein n=1 Tax=Streptomyces sp. yr375 TaxID=1761906 RepID=UPI0008CBD80F|nr:prenyltransferase/squalene oxidase repeat-containing protein [Streptomyces sp. yr375]SEP59308.1 squalene-hopene/tetraprenyl-beta-curcumene cyclase [Streptomyces sp. yr375]